MDDNTPNKSSAATKWAIVIGINFYSASDPRQNLKGCVNDALLFNSFLVNDLGVSTDKIFLHIGEDAKSASTKFPNAQSHKLATRLEILSSITTIASHSVPGDLVFFHFSGHGDRDDRRDAAVEYLCFADHDLKDVEFGKQLDDLAKDGDVTVLVTLDCCFSGGATRYRYDSTEAIRCKPKGLDQDFDDDRGNFDEDEPQRQLTLQKGILYRDRHYTVMTACQPHEKCREWRNDELNGNIHGVFTSSLVELFKRFRNGTFSSYLLTYEILHSILETAVLKKCDDRRKRRQHPTLFGPRSRMLFDKVTVDDTPGFALVTEVNRSTITLNRGHIAGTAPGDTYKLIAPSSSQHNSLNATQNSEIEVKVTNNVSAFACEVVGVLLPKSATQPIDFRSTVALGWQARLVEKAVSIKATIFSNDDPLSINAVKLIQDSWNLLQDPTLPIVLEANPNSVPQQKPQFWMNVSAGFVEIRNSDNESFEHLQKIPVTFPDFPRRAFSVLRHLAKYLSLFRLESPSGSARVQDPYRLYISDTKYDLRSNLSTLDDSMRTINVKNYSGQYLYVTVFNLTPLYGVIRLYPTTTGEGSSGGKPVSDGKWMTPKDIPITIEVPKVLAERYSKDPNFRMTDILKVFVTTRPLNLGFYELDDLDTVYPEWFEDPSAKDDLTENVINEHRHGKRITDVSAHEDEWWVETYEIVTKGLTTKS